MLRLHGMRFNKRLQLVMRHARCTECGAELRLVPTLCPLCGAEIKREAVSFDGWQVSEYQAEVRRLRGELAPEDRRRRGPALVKLTEEG